MFNNSFFLEMFIFYEIKWKLLYSRTSQDDNIMGHMRIMCSITKATNTHHGNYGYANVPQCYVSNTLSYFYILL
jgi:hypothetical protein